MREDLLTSEERELLLFLARQALDQAVRGERLLPLDLERLPERLRQPGATFVTLTLNGELRGCVGALEAYLPLAEDVRDHAVAAGQQDYRFLPVTPEEMPRIEIEISRLTSPQPLEYDCPENLLTSLQPGIDGVILRDGPYRATFLPQVWEKIPDPAFFLSYLCQKMGADSYLWRHKKLQVFTYQVEEFSEQKTEEQPVSRGEEP
jgi:AmmeMemoRadiSam system protein A